MYDVICYFYVMSYKMSYMAIASGERPARSAAIWYHTWYYIWHHIWYNNIFYVISCVISCICLVTWALIWYHIWYHIKLSWYHIWHHMWYSMFVQEVVVLLAPFPNNPNPVAEFDVVRDFDLTRNGLVWYALPQLFFNCTLCTRGCQGPEYSANHKEVSLCISAHLSPSIWPQTASYNRQVCPCCTTLPATSDCPAYTSAQWQMCWGEPPSSPASY